LARKKKKDDDDIETLVDEVFPKNTEKLIQSMEAANQITEETEKFLKSDELWEAAATQMEVRLLILSMSGMLAFAVTEHGGLYLDHLIEEEENNENSKG
jgi:hypothetical protein